MVVICAGVSQKPGESRLDLLKRNAAVFQSIISPITHSGFSGIFLVATNPVDIMTRITCDLSGFNPRRVLGTGTTLDTARLRYLLGGYLKADPRNVHAYVIGEHGDSGICAVEPGNAGHKADFKFLRGAGKPKGAPGGPGSDFRGGAGAAYRIIEAKHATYYGIGMALTRITKAILGDEHSVLTVSAMLKGEYGQSGVFVGVPCIINKNGIQSVLTLSLTEEEQSNLAASCETLRESYEGIL